MRIYHYFSAEVKITKVPVSGHFHFIQARQTGRKQIEASVEGACKYYKEK